MAFSTQKDFFNRPFLNESVDYECKKACVKLKSYDSCIDDRSWTGDEAKQSKFLSDLVTCHLPVGMGKGEGDSIVTSGNAIRGDNIISQLDGLTTGGDSLLECANIHLAEYQKIMNIKTSLEKQLEISNERLKTAKDENKKIKEILNTKLDSNTAKDFYNKIQKLIAAGKLERSEKNDMLQIYQKMENLYKSYEILQAENNYLKRLVDKLTARITLDNFDVELENSTDVDYLQQQINKLRRECLMLRQIEENYLKIKQKSDKSASAAISEQDAEHIKAIIKERNGLREKCKSLKALQKQVHDLEEKASEAVKAAHQSSNNLNNQSDYIKNMEDELKNMQKYCDQQNSRACRRENYLKAQIEDLQNELVHAKCKFHAKIEDLKKEFQTQKEKLQMELVNAKCQTQKFEMEVDCLRNEVLKRNMAINDYDCQYKQLMDVVTELQAIKVQSLEDNQTQTCENQTDELAYYTCATLHEIMKELKKKGCLTDEIGNPNGFEPRLNDNDDQHNRECCIEKSRLQNQLEDMQKKLEAAADCDAICAEALKRVKDLEAENARLLQDFNKTKQEKELLNNKLKEGEERMANMLAKIDRLDNEIKRNAQDAYKIQKDLEGTMGLVKDISDIQLRNQQMANAVSAINSRDDQKIIDDLRRHIEEELVKLRKCQQDRDRLIKESEQRESDLKNLQTLNNKLESDKRKLEADKQKLQDDNTNLFNRLNNRELGEKIKGNYEIVKQDKYSSKDSKKPIGNKKKTAALPNDAQRDEAATVDDFVKKNSESIKFNLNQGQGFDKELRKIFNEFIQECGFAFCRLFNPKGKFYIICHKLCHNGIKTLSFLELAYMHKKIFDQAEQIRPGCLLNIILTNIKEDAQNFLISHQNRGGGKVDSKISGTNITDADKKCCSCQNELCCNSSEESLKEKVNKLEKDIETARQHLDSFKNSSLDAGPKSDNGYSIAEDDNLTYRATSSFVVVPQKSSSTKHIKKLKARLIKNQDKYYS